MIELLTLSIALSLDAFAVTISDSISYNKEPFRRMILFPIAFGVFQGIMPFLGYFLSGVFADLIQRYAGIVSLVILGAIGINMIYEGVTKKVDKEVESNRGSSITFGMILLQAIATSIDAFAVGISLRAMNVNIVEYSLVICCITFILTLIALRIGQKFGSLLGDRAQIVGGVVLICIGIHAIF